VVVLVVLCLSLVELVRAPPVGLSPFLVAPLRRVVGL